MIEYILSVSLLIAAVMIIRAVFRKTVSPRVIYALWLVVVIRMILPVSLFEVSITVPKFLRTEQNTQNHQTEQIHTPPSEIGGIDDGFEELPPPTIPITPIIPDDNAEPSMPTETPVTPTIPNEPEPVIPSEPVISHQKSVSLTPIQIINIVWLAGVVVAEGVLIFTAVRYEERLCKSRKFYKNIGRTKIYISESAEVPCVAGFIPSIYITPECISNNSENLIVIHEHCHIRHGDHIWSYIRVASLVIFWWNPLVWIAAMISKHDAELACDDAVSLALTDSERIKYANILIDTIPQKRKYAVGLGSAPMKERIIMLSKKQKNSLICIVLTIILALSAVGCSFASFDEKETTSADDSTTLPETDTEYDETDIVTEPDVQTNATFNPETDTHIYESGEGYFITMPERILTITGDKFETRGPEGTFSHYPWYLYQDMIAEVVIQDGVNVIHSDMFSEFYNLKKVTIPDGVTAIEDCAFRGCSSLENIVIPDSVTSIGSWVFSKCTTLKNISIPDSVTKLGSALFWDCTLLENVKLSRNITEICDWMFYGCEKLSSIDIPDGVTVIGDNAFYNCSSLSTVTMGDSVETISDRAFYQCKNLKNIKLSKNLKRIYLEGFKNCTNMEYIDLPEGLEFLECAFEGCTSLKSIEIPDGVDITANVFVNCTSLEYIEIPGKVFDPAPGGTLSGCTNLKSVVIKDGATSIGMECMAYCTNLETVEIPNSVKYIDQLAFQKCTNLKEIRFKGTEEEWNAIRKEEQWDLDAGDYTIIFEK